MVANLALCAAAFGQSTLGDPFPAMGSGVSSAATAATNYAVLQPQQSAAVTKQRDAEKRVVNELIDRESLCIKNARNAPTPEAIQRARNACDVRYKRLYAAACVGGAKPSRFANSSIE